MVYMFDSAFEVQCLATISHREGTSWDRCMGGGSTRLENIKLVRQTSYQRPKESTLGRYFDTYSLLFGRNLKHWPICFCFSWRTLWPLHSEGHGSFSSPSLSGVIRCAKPVPALPWWQTGKTKGTLDSIPTPRRTCVNYLAAVNLIGPLFYWPTLAGSGAVYVPRSTGLQLAGSGAVYDPCSTTGRVWSCLLTANRLQQSPDPQNCSMISQLSFQNNIQKCHHQDSITQCSVKTRELNTSLHLKVY